MDSLLQTLQSKFRLSEFRPRQREIIEDVLAGRDTLCVMPTGAGKSLCFQLPAVMRGGLTIVISPLVSLMADQVRQLKQLGIPALILNSTQTPKEQRAIVQQAGKAADHFRRAGQDDRRHQAVFRAAAKGRQPPQQDNDSDRADAGESARNRGRREPKVKK